MDDIQAGLRALLDAGTPEVQAGDTGGGKLTATVQDADGNVTGLMQNP